jgi:AraC family transcriptional regulator
MLFNMEPGTSVIEAELNLPAATVQIYQFDLVEQMLRTLREERCYRLDLSVSPRLPGSAMCFADHWSSQRFERPGRLFVLPPGETLHVRNGLGRQTAIICHLPVDSLSAWFDGDLEWTDRLLEASLDISSQSIGNLLLQLGHEARHPGFACAALSEGIAMQIAVHLQRYFRENVDEPESGGLAPWRLRLIDERLREFSQPPTLSELSALCKLSVRQLSRAFRVSRSLSLGDYVAKYRMEHAKCLLGDAKSIKSVAYAMGFASPSSFCYAFRQATGMAPQEYRVQARG